MLARPSRFSPRALQTRDGCGSRETLAGHAPSKFEIPLISLTRVKRTSLNGLEPRGGRVYWRDALDNLVVPSCDDDDVPLAIALSDVVAHVRVR